MFKILEVDGSSPQGFSEAVRGVIGQLLASGQEVSYFQVMEERGAVRGGALNAAIHLQQPK